MEKGTGSSKLQTGGCFTASPPMTERPPPPLSAFRNAKLVNANGQQVQAKSLWAEQPVLFVLIRRPGCGESEAYDSHCAVKSQAC